MIKSEVEKTVAANGVAISTPIRKDERVHHQQSRTLSGTGTIYSFSIMYNVPHGFEEQKPYVIAIIQLDEGPMVTAQLTDINHDEVAIGQRVEMVTRKLREEGGEGQIIYGYKFRPAIQDSIGR